MAARIPYDAMILSSVLEEISEIVGAYIDRVRALDESTLVLRTRSGDLLISCDPRAPRFYAPTRVGKGKDTQGFFRLVKDRIESGKIEILEQIGFDRRFRLVAKGHELVVDLIGTRANMTLFGPSGAIGRLRNVSGPQGDAPKTFADAVRLGKGLSKTLMAEAAAGVDLLQTTIEPVYYQGIGAYPFPLVSVQAKPMPMTSINSALELYYSEWLPKLDAEALVKSLCGQLEHARKARIKSLSQIDDVLDTAGRARTLQTFGELILAFSPRGVAVLETKDYDGNNISIPLDPESTPVENAERYFSKARKAKLAAGDLAPKAERLRRELVQIEDWLSTLDEYPMTIAQQARDSGMIREQAAPEKREIRHEGHRVREADVEGYVVLWGENATANDYVTTRLAKPNDYWLHVRGAHGSHVVLKTNNKPERVPQSAILGAAKIAAKNSNQKHASHVPVTVTLAKYVRKPRKSAPGAVTFTNDKTLFVDP